MSAENLVQIDLSQENKTAHIADTILTPEEKVQLETQLAAEKEGILSLTQQELEELKSILSIERSIGQNPRWPLDSAFRPWETLGNFIETQKIEGISTSDIMSWVEGNLFTPELLDQFDTLSQDMLFGTEGIFSGLDISQKAQESASVSFSLALLEKIQTSPTQIQQLMDPATLQNPEAIGEILASFGWENMTQIGAHFQQAQEEVRPAYQIDGAGEKNKIFMDTPTGVDFFRRILSGEITLTNIHAEIDKQDAPSPLETSLGDISILQDIGTFTPEELQALTAPVDPSSTASDTPVIPDPEGVLAPLNTEEAQTATERLAEMQPLGPFLAAILEFLKGLGAVVSPESENSGEATETQSVPATDEDTPSSTPENTSSSFLSTFQALELSGEDAISRDSLLTEIQGNEVLQNQIQITLESISPDEIAIQSLQDLYGPEKKITGVSSAFEAQWIFANTPEGTSNGEKFLTLLREYATYRNTPWVRDVTENRTTWLAYGEFRKGQGWNSVGR